MASAKTSASATAAPKLPAWLRSGDHVSVLNLTKRAQIPADAAVATAAPPSLKTATLAVQEQALLEDLLFLMDGFDGRYITIKTFDLQPNSTPTFQTDPSLDRALDHLVGRVLPVCASYLVISSFVEQGMMYDMGLVSHALCAAIQSLLKEYLVLVAQLEQEFIQGALTLQRLWFFVQPSAANLRSLEAVVHILRANHCKGGAILDQLHEHMTLFSGDIAARDAYAFLLEEASRPYFAMIEDWVYRGLIQDPYLEFMVRYIKPKADDDSAKIFAENYVLLKVPSFLSDVSELILKAGKYLNVIRQSALPIPEQPMVKLEFAMNKQAYIAPITAAHAFAAEQLLSLLMHGKNLKEHLASMKRLFFLECGDVFVHFTDIAGEDLTRNVHDISVSKLQSLFEIAVRSSSTAPLIFTDHVRVAFSELSLIDELMRILQVSQRTTTDAPQKPTTMPGIVSSPTTVQRAPQSLLTGVQALLLQYVVAWPLSLVINTQAQQQYQMIFRHLFFCRHVERQLGLVWVTQQSWKRFRTPVVMHAFSLRNRMLSFVQNFMYYVMVEVLEPQWIKLNDELTRVHTVDDVIKQHADFLKTCLDQCMLTDERLLQILGHLFSVCLIFCNQVSSYPALPWVGRAKLPEDPDHFAGLERAVRKIDDAFTQHLRELIVLTINGKRYLTTLAYRLDFNGFYSRREPATV